MSYIFDDWKKVLENFQNSVEKDLQEIHQQKAEVQQIKTDIFDRLDSGLFYRDDQRIVISAPEIVIGNVDKSGTLQGGNVGRVIIKGSDVSLEGVGDAGQIVSRAPSIRQVAVNPGVDGLENVVCDRSEVVSQACSILLHSSDAKDAFSQSPVPVGRGGVSIHADNNLELEAAVSAELRKAQIEQSVNAITDEITELKKSMSAQKKIVDDCFKSMAKLMDDEDKLNTDSDYMARVKLRDIEMIHEDIEEQMPALYQATQSFINLVSRLAELNRRKKALETEKGAIKTGDDFKGKTTGATMSIKAESIDIATADGDGNTHTNPEAGINVRTPRLGVSMHDDQGKLVEDGGLSVNAQNISFSTVNPSESEMPAVGNVSILSKTINLEAVDYQVDDILAGKANETIRNRAKAAKFDERLSLLGLMLDRVGNDIRQNYYSEQVLGELVRILKKFKTDLNNTGATADNLLQLQITEKRKEIWAQYRECQPVRLHTYRVFAKEFSGDTASLDVWAQSSIAANRAAIKRGIEKFFKEVCPEEEVAQ